MPVALAANRWCVYQRERFPLAAHAPLIFAFSFSAVSFSALARGAAPPAPAAVAVAFLTSLLFLLQLRIADEFKDFEEDARYRPYRPVPRGLVKLTELGAIGAVGALAQLAAALWFHRPLALLLAVAWAYLALMSKEFFARDWLKVRPVTYLWTHMLIMPLIDLYATACDWLVAGRAWPPDGLAWFLAASFFNGVVIEIGRKIRAPEDEERGVETYTVLWGRPKAVAAWLTAMTLTALGAVAAARAIGFAAPLAAILATVLAAALALGLAFLRRPVNGLARRFEWVSGLWTLALYLGLGALPLAFRI